MIYIQLAKYFLLTSQISASHLIFFSPTAIFDAPKLNMQEKQQFFEAFDTDFPMLFNVFREASIFQICWHFFKIIVFCKAMLNIVWWLWIWRLENTVLFSFSKVKTFNHYHEVKVLSYWVKSVINYGTCQFEQPTKLTHKRQ